VKHWVFERRTRDGGASGEAVPNAVEAGGWSSSEELLVREAIQNSVDAWRPGCGPVKVVFRLQHLVEGEKASVLEELSLAPFAERMGVLGGKLPAGNVIERSAEPLAALNLLYVEDYNTVGLGGDLEDGNYYRLLFTIGEGSKADKDDGSGGSFGFGKGVYAHNSNLRMIFVFSTFEPSAETNGNWARLLGCAYLPSHEHEGKRWTGRAWFGVPSGDDVEGQSPYPIVDDEAVALAQKLGFATRGPADLGTSVLIIGSDSQEGVLKLDNLQAAAETWWWPRLIDGDLTVELVEQGIRAPGLDPARRADLQPFIRCRTAILRGHDDENVKLRTFNRKHGLSLGLLALTAVQPDQPSWEALNHDSDEFEDRQGKAPAHRTVAYIRRPGMVVTYRAWSISSSLSAVGTFQADDDVDQHLKLSEPMEHDRWDPHSGRLERLPYGHEIVRAIEEGIRRRLRDFLKELQPPPPPPKTGLNWLGKRLGEILTPRTKAAPPGPEGDRGGVSIVTEVRPHFTATDAGNQVRLKATYSISLKPDVDLEEATVSFSPRLAVLEGDNGARGDLVPLDVWRCDDEDSTIHGAEANLEMSITATERQVVEVVSDPFSADWSVAVHIEVSQLAEKA